MIEVLLETRESGWRSPIVKSTTSWAVRGLPHGRDWPDALRRHGVAGISAMKVSGSGMPDSNPRHWRTSHERLNFARTTSLRGAFS